MSRTGRRTSSRTKPAVVSYADDNALIVAEFVFPLGCIVKAIWREKVINNKGEMYAYPAVIVGWNIDGTYAVQYDDDGFLASVPETHIKLCKRDDLTFGKFCLLVYSLCTNSNMYRVSERV